MFFIKGVVRYNRSVFIYKVSGKLKKDSKWLLINPLTVHRRTLLCESYMCLTPVPTIVLGTSPYPLTVIESGLQT